MDLVIFLFKLKNNLELFKIKSVYNNKATSFNTKIACVARRSSQLRREKRMAKL